VRERDSYFDNLKFVLIFLVVLGHIIEPYLNNIHIMKTLYLWLYSFHMPLFVFVAGYFSKSINSPHYSSKLFQHIVFPYFIFETLYSIFDYVVNKREILDYSYFTPYWILWFLFSLMIWKVTLPYIIKFKYALIFSVILSVMIGYASDAGYYASVSRTIVFYPFFLAGYYFDKQVLVKLKAVYYKLIASFIVSLTFAGYYILSTKINEKWFYGASPYKAIGYEAWYAGAFRLGLIVLACIVGFSILLLIPKKRIALLTDLGKNTMYVYLLHPFIISYLSTTSFFSFFNTPLKKLLLVLFALVITMLLASNMTKAIFQFLVNPALIYKKYRENNNASITKST